MTKKTTKMENTYPNLAITYTSKYKNPETDIWDHATLTPACVNNKLAEGNLIVVTCEPSLIGVYKWNRQDIPSPKIWKNGKMNCYYIPIDKCEFIDLFDFLGSIQNEDKQKWLADYIIKQQNKWYKGQVKNKEAYKLGKPTWMIQCQEKLKEYV